MSITLRLPGAAAGWPLPGWTDAELRFAWNVARDEAKEFRIEQRHPDGTVDHLIIYPAEIPWYEIVGGSSE